MGPDPDGRYKPRKPRKGDKIGAGWRATPEELERMARFVNKVGFGADGKGPKLEQWKRFWRERANGELVSGVAARAMKIELIYLLAGLSDLRSTKTRRLKPGTRFISTDAQRLGQSPLV